MLHHHQPSQFTYDVLPTHGTLLDMTLPLGLPTALLSMLLVVLLDLCCIHDQQHDIVTYWRSFGKQAHPLRLVIVLDDTMLVVIKN